MNLYLHCRQCHNVEVARNKARSVKSVFILIFFITTITNSLFGQSMDILGNYCLYLAFPPHNACTVSQCKRAMKKWGEILLFYVFALKFTLQAMNHCDHCSLADINGPFLPSSHSDPTLLPPNSHKNVAQCLNARKQGEML
jgi:hypothetical protein